MNKLTQNLFQVIYPFYPLWAWVTVSFLHFPTDKILVFLLLPSLVYIILYVKIQIPAYLIFLIFFTIYHLGSVYSNDLMPPTTNWFFFFFSDSNVLACILFLVIENTNFEDGFITRMNRNIFIIVMLSLVVSVIQVKNILFFYNLEADSNPFQTYYEENRITSIYSWVDINTVGVTFPIMISILLSVYDFKSKPFPFITISGIIVAFLTRARYAMISVIIAFSQLFLVRAIPLKKKIYAVLFFVGGIFLLIGVSHMVGYDVNKIIDERIMEKGTDMGSAKTRMLSYEVFMKKFPEHPYFGVGPKTKDDVIDLLGGEAMIIHVGYLSYLYYYGYTGALIMFIGLFLLLREAWLVGRRFAFWGGFYGLLGFALANFTFVNFTFSEMGIVLAVIYMRYYKVNSIRLYN